MNTKVLSVLALVALAAGCIPQFGAVPGLLEVVDESTQVRVEVNAPFEFTEAALYFGGTTALITIPQRYFECAPFSNGYLCTNATDDVPAGAYVFNVLGDDVSASLWLTNSTTGEEHVSRQEQ